MDTCSNCDFCEVMEGGSCYCVLYDERVGANNCCEDHQHDTRRIDGDIYA